MKKLHIFGTTCACISSILIFTSNAAAAVLPLEGRLETTLGSGIYQAYYDPNLNITWAADANINGSSNWDSQTAWVSSLTIGGVGGWRLPEVDVNGDGGIFDCTGGGIEGCEDNEMSYLFWDEGITASTPGPFANIQPHNYWLAEVASNPTDAWRLSQNFGTLGVLPKNISTFAWAVHDGDVGAVPIPAAAWLFGSGLLGLIGVARRKKV